MTKWILFLLYFNVAVLTLNSQSAHAASAKLRSVNGTEVIVSAAQLELAGDKYELNGQVQIIFGSEHISCDHAVVLLKQDTVIAEGNFVLVSPSGYIEGDKAQFNFREKTGRIENGFVKSGPVVFEGTTLLKTGDDTYEADQAYYTACATCPPGWSFTGKKITARIGGYAYVRSGWFRIGGVPLLPIPYLIVPLKSERQSGILTPGFEFGGKSGVTASFPFFWAISRSQDATLTFKNHEFRGQKGLLDYRYVLNATSEGQLQAGHIQDRFFVKDEPTFKDQTDPKYFNRWFINYQHFYDLPDGFTQFTKLNLVSDLFYPRDFSDEIKGWGDPALENRAYLSRNTETTHSSIDASYFSNLLKSDPTAGNTEAVHRMPEIRFSIAEQKVLQTRLLFKMDADFVNFARQDFAYDDVVNRSDLTNPNDRCLPAADDINFPRSKFICRERGGSYDKTVGQFDPAKDQIRAGQRLDLTPEVSYPFQISKLIDVSPALMFRHTQYNFDISPDSTAQTPESARAPFNRSPFRDYFAAQVSARTRFSRVFEFATTNSYDNIAPNRSDSASPSAAQATRFKHEIFPELIVSRYSLVHQSDSAFLGSASSGPSSLDTQPISDSDFLSEKGKGIQFDYYDRITNRNLITAVIGNRITKKSWSNGDPEYNQIVNFRLSQSYDLDASRRSPSLPWSDIAALLDVRHKNFETNTLARYYPYHNYTNTSSRVRLKRDRGDYLELSLTQTFLITENFDEAFDNRSEDVGTAVGFQSRYLNLQSGLRWLPEKWDKQYKVKSWFTYLEFKPPGDCWSIQVKLQQEIQDQSLKARVNFEFQFGADQVARPTQI